ncbi:MAG: PqiC family protein [Candidatus Thiodiazotropha sp.]
MPYSTRVRTAIFALLLSQLFHGCAGPSQPTRFYRLDAHLDRADAVSLKPSTGQQLIAIGPITLADYLDRPQIIERQSPHRLQLHEFDHWAGSLKENIVQLLTDLVRRRLDDMQVVSYPWHGSLRPDYEVVMKITRFDREGDRVWLQLSWSLIQAQERRLVEMQQLVLEEPITGTGIDAGVAASSRVIGQLAQRIAAAIGEAKQP